MSGNIVRLKANDGTPVEFIDEVKGAGGLKDCYFSTDRSYVVLFYRSPLDAAGKDRINSIVGRYKDNIFNQAGGA